LRLPDLAATEALASRIAAGARPGDVLALVGPLGAGKTTLVRALVVALGGDARDVVSPTFALVQHYEARLPVTHVDAYRLGGADALRALGHEEVFPEGADGLPIGLTAVEWADLVRDALPSAAAWVRIDGGQGDARTVEVEGPTEVLVRLGLADDVDKSRQTEAAP